nr:uncharacterized protein LOC109178468 [Ipomoea trifida]
MRSKAPGPTTNLVSEPVVMGDQSLTEAVQNLQTAVEAMKADQDELRQMFRPMKADQDELRQMFRQFLAGKDTTSSSNTATAPPPTPAVAPVPTYVPKTATAPKYTRLEFPRFDGREDPSGWLHQCEQFFRAQGTPAGDYVSLAAFHLIGSNALGCLVKLNQGGRPVEAYDEDFQSALLCTSTNLDVAMNFARSYSRRQLSIPEHQPLAHAPFTSFAGGHSRPATQSQRVARPAPASSARLGQTASTPAASSASSVSVANPRAAPSSFVAGGVNWLRTLGAIVWDFAAQTMTFSYGGHPVTWQGERISPNPLLNAIQPSISVNALEHILTDYFDLFQEPKALPPQRQCDHRITLLTGADPLLGYNFDVEFRAGRLNIVADALSRRDEEVSTLMALSAPVSPVLDSLRQELTASDAAKGLIGKLNNGSAGPNWSLDGQLIRFKGFVAVKAKWMELKVLIVLRHNILDS